MTTSGWKQARDRVAVGTIAALLGLSFSAGLAGGTDPDYGLQRMSPEWDLQAAPGATCESIALEIEFSERLDADLDRDVSAHRDALRRLQRKLGCDN